MSAVSTRTRSATPSERAFASVASGRFPVRSSLCQMSTPIAVPVESEVCCAEGFDHVALLVAVGDSKAERVAAHWHPLGSVARQRPGQPKAVSGGCAGSTGFQWPGDAAEVFRLKGSGIRDKPGGAVEKLEERLSPGFPQLIFPCRSHNDAVRIFRRVRLSRPPDRLHAISG